MIQIMIIVITNIYVNDGKSEEEKRIIMEDPSKLQGSVLPILVCSYSYRYTCKLPVHPATTLWRFTSTE